MQKKEQKLRISLRLGFREGLGVALCALLFLIGPIIVYNYFQSTNFFANTAGNETQTEGQVAGINTIEAQVDSKYFVIPLINYKFDTTLSETSSIVFLLGGLLLIGATIFAITLVIDSSKQMVIKHS